LDHTWFLINQHTLEWTTKRRCNLAVPLPHPLRRSTTPTRRARLPGQVRHQGRFLPHDDPSDALASPSSSPNDGKNKWWRSPRPDHGLDQLAPHFLCHVGDGVTANARLYRRTPPPHRLNIGVNPRHPSISDLPPILDGPSIRRRETNLRTGTARTGHSTDDLQARSERPAVADASTGAPASTGQRERVRPLSSDDPMMTHPRTPSRRVRAPAPPDAQPPHQAGSIHRRLRRRLHRRRPGKAPPAHGARTLMHAIDEVLKAPRHQPTNSRSPLAV
jgi:hypothetical protein